MTLQPIDPHEFTRAQRESWGAVAQGWRKWWPTFEAGAQALNERLVELAGIREGDTVLDVATGIGEPALTAARQVGPKGRVLGTDLAPPMLAVARERAVDAGLHNVEFREADAQVLDLEPASFDAALCRWGVMLVLDPLAALTAIRRTLRPGARFAASVWGGADEVPFLTIPMQAARRELGTPAPPADAPGPLRLGRRGALEALYAQAGFTNVASEDREVVMSYTSSAQYVSFLQDISSSLNKELGGRPRADHERVWESIAREASRHADAGGRVRFVNTVRIAVGVR